MTFNELLSEELWNGEKSVCFFVCKGVCYWVLDYKYNFSLDAEKDYSAYLKRGYITQEQYEQACKEFRGGILKLTSDNFREYLVCSSATIVSKVELEDYFNSSGGGGLLRIVEKYYLSGGELEADVIYSVGRAVSKLPMFYINFDRKIYMHMDTGRSHEELAYPDWSAKCSDFCFLIPDVERYWVKGGDYWKLRFIH
ncbi:hypothetical protein [Pseudomonas entomophila]|uniref:hypothetical protein n=1 Tax=Pseudomonas entomophila TaxID=312306 RepID=UPI001F0265EC|nr:hypothetical protein [Pseudomonas entomophila]MCG8296581.1 hypothetical protein [Pseudomonas entomophila]